MFKINCTVSIVLILMLYSMPLYANCLQIQVSMLTEEGKFSGRENIPVTIKDREDNVIKSGSTNKYGRVCLSYGLATTGQEVTIETGDKEDAKGEQQKAWSSWVVLSPFQGITHLPSGNIHTSIEVIITPPYMYSTFFNDSSREKVVKKIDSTCKVSKNNGYVQVASLRTITDARVVENTIKFDYSTCIVPVNVKNKNYYRVFVIPDSKSSPKWICKDIKKKYKYKCFYRYAKS